MNVVEISKNAIEYVRKNKKDIVQKFASDERYPRVDYPVSVFMAGSPGAGKTEFSKRFIERFQSEHENIIRIDSDDIRAILPGYTGDNSQLFQGACSIAVDAIHDYALEKRKHFILDGTFAHYDIAHRNIERSVKRKRIVTIIYLYQDPLKAWDFTKGREVQEGRNIPKQAFIDQLFDAIIVVNKIKEEYPQVRIILVERDYSSEDYVMKMNIDKIDKYIQIMYSREQLMELLK